MTRNIPSQSELRTDPLYRSAVRLARLIELDAGEEAITKEAAIAMDYAEAKYKHPDEYEESRKKIIERLLEVPEGPKMDERVEKLEAKMTMVIAEVKWLRACRDLDKAWENAAKNGCKPE